MNVALAMKENTERLGDEYVFDGRSDRPFEQLSATERGDDVDAVKRLTKSGGMPELMQQTDFDNNLEGGRVKGSDYSSSASTSLEI